MKRGCCKTMSYDELLRAGQRITGKWNGFVYQVERLLGSGANGHVYMVLRGGQLYAMKIGREALDFQSEINGLNELQQQTATAQPFVIDVDDAVIGGRDFSFYVMKYVQGTHPAKFLHENGTDWYPVIGHRILGKLAELHARGYIFGDLKSDNILVSGFGTAELIDYGGLTRFGKAVRQYTERFDRGYWRAGSRSAEPAYDLFAFAVLCLELAHADTGRLAKLETDPERSVEQLCRLAKESPQTRTVAPVIEACLNGRLRSAADAQYAWKDCIYTTRASAAGAMTNERSGRRVTMGLAAAFAASLAVFAAVLYWTLGNVSLH